MRLKILQKLLSFPSSLPEQYWDDVRTVCRKLKEQKIEKFGLGKSQSTMQGFLKVFLEAYVRFLHRLVRGWPSLRRPSAVAVP
jgi:hypothetical protein